MIRVLLIVLLGLAQACGNADGPAETAAAAPTRVHVTPAREGEISATLEVSGEVEALRVLRLASPVAGRITFLAARSGDHFAEGDVAARIMPFESEAALQGFAMLEGISGLSAAERRTMARVQKGHGDIPLPLPFAGVVADRTRNPGEQVAAGDILLELFDPRSLDVLAQVPLAARSRVHLGQTVQVEGEGIRSEGQIVAMLATVSPASLTVPVRVSLRTPPEQALLHAPVRCWIVTARHHHAILVPRSALLSTSGTMRGVVSVAAGGVAVRTPIRVGIKTDDWVEVHGLGVGDLVLVGGGYELPDRARIDPVAEAP